MDILRTKIQVHKTAILRDLDLNKGVLSHMTSSGLLDLADCVKLQVLP